MDKKVSVIIPKSDDHTYLIRCLSSIRRQVYKNIDIFVLEDVPEDIVQQYNLIIYPHTEDSYWEQLNNAIRKADGDYLFFCSMTSVIAPNVIEALVRGIEEKEADFPVGCYAVEGSNGFNLCEEAAYTIFGKLFERNKILSENIWFKDGYIFSDVLFVLKYQGICQSTKVNDTAYIYESDCKLLPNRQLGDVQQEEVVKMFEQMNQLEEEKRSRFLFHLWKLMNQSEQVPEHLILEINRSLYSEYQLNYDVAQKFVKKWYKDAETNNDEHAYEMVKDYLGTYDGNEDYQRTILMVCGISKDMYVYMKKYNLKEFLFYKKCWFEELLKTSEVSDAKRAIDEYIDQCEAKFEASVSDMEKRLTESVNNSVNNIISEFGSRSESTNMSENLSGPDLAVYVIEKYRQGCLGIKTLLKSLIAWIKYKI